MTTDPHRLSDGEWFVVVLTDHKGEIATAVWYGRDPDDAPEDIARADPAGGTRWLVHAENGFTQRSDAEARAETIRADVGGRRPQQPGKSPLH